jgi:hypothetical protein
MQVASSNPSAYNPTVEKLSFREPFSQLLKLPSAR